MLELYTNNSPELLQDTDSGPVLLSLLTMKHVQVERGPLLNDPSNVVLEHRGSEGPCRVLLSPVAKPAGPELGHKHRFVGLHKRERRTQGTAALTGDTHTQHYPCIKLNLLFSFNQMSLLWHPFRNAPCTDDYSYGNVQCTLLDRVNFSCLQFWSLAAVSCTKVNRKHVQSVYSCCSISLVPSPPRNVVWHICSMF